MPEILYDPNKDNYWLSVGHSTVGTIHRTLTQKLLHDRWLACMVLDNARVAVEVAGGEWKPVEVNIMKNGEPQSWDVI